MGIGKFLTDALCLSF